MSYVSDKVKDKDKYLLGLLENKDGKAMILYYLLNSNFVVRYVAYFSWYIFTGVIVAFAVFGGTDIDMHHNSDMQYLVAMVLSFLISYGIPIYLEVRVLQFRKKYKLSFFKGVQREVAEIREEITRDKNSVVVKQDKSDIGYWHGLLEKGAITQEEYDKKKEELL